MRKLHKLRPGDRVKLIRDSCGYTGRRGVVGSVSKNGRTAKVLLDNPIRFDDGSQLEYWYSNTVSLRKVG